jgi:predicted transcriptional regulator
VNVTLSLNDDLIRRVRRIAAERDTTLTAMIRKHLDQVAAEEAASGRRRREQEALERSFQKFRFPVGAWKWTRQDLQERS